MFFIASKKVAQVVLLSIVFFGPATAAKLTKMQKVAHASPMPNLMMVVGMNAQILGLSKEQKAVFKKWKKNNQQRTQLLVKNIIELETEIKESVLDGIVQAEMDELKNDLLALRGELMDVKYRCVSNIRSSLDSKQWIKLMELQARASRVASSGNRAGNEIQAFLRVSPMPKLMAIVLMHKKELMLTGKQNDYLEGWRLEHMNHWALLFEQVLNTEKKITQRSLEMESSVSLMKDFEAMTKSRRRMAEMSLNCRDNMKKVLSDEQWKEVIRLLKSYL